MLRTLLAISLIALVAAACAGPAATSEPTAAPTTAPTAAPATVEPTPEPATPEPATAEPTAEPATAEPSAPAGDTVALSTEGYLVGPDGLSLYTFDPDEPGVSNCEGDCLVNWPALSVESEDALTVGDGLDAAMFSTFARSDGSLQVAFNEMPLYYFIGDTAPGDINGDGLNDVWHLARPLDGADAAVSIGPDGHLVGLEGLTLYIFDNDDPGVSNCAGECLVNWPAVLVTAADDMTLGENLDATDFGTITRDDGTVQVTYQDMPLYFFIGDTAPGDVNGDGLNDVWHIISIDDATSAIDPIDY